MSLWWMKLFPLIACFGFAATLLIPLRASADPEFVNPILFEANCGLAIQAAVAFSNNDVASIFREDEKAAAYAFLLGLGARDPRPGSEKEVFGRGIGAAAFFCDRNRDVSIFEIGRLLGRE
jgi:hypothetical protein